MRSPPDAPDPSPHPSWEQLAQLLRVVEEYAVVLLDGAGRIRSWNRGAERITGHPAADAVGRLYERFFPKEIPAPEVPPPSPDSAFDGSRITRSGAPIWVHEVTHPVADAEPGGPVALRIVHDLGARLETVRELRESERRYRALVEWSPGPTFLHDASGVVYANRSAVQLLGRTDASELLGQPLFSFVHPQDRARVRRRVRKAVEQSVPTGTLEVRISGDGKQWRTAEVALVPIEHKGAPAVQVIAHDVSVRKQAEVRLQHEALHDPLTGLPNRALLFDRLEHAVASVHRHPDRRFAVLFLDLDDFKRINDTYGHRAGDLLLVEFAQRLRGSVRPRDTVARLAGDEFIVLLEDLAEPREAVGAAERIRNACGGVFRIEQHEIELRTSVGIALNTGDSSPEALLQRADRALYRAKTGGGGQWVVYDEQIHHRVTERVALEDQMFTMSASDRLRLDYAPVFDLASRSAVGRLAQLWWDHPEQGRVVLEALSPEVVGRGLGTQLDAWLIRAVCRDSRARRDGLTTLVPLPSRLLLPQLPTWIEAALAEDGGSADPLRVLIPTTVLAEEPRLARQVVRQLAALSVGVVATEFGQGSSAVWLLEEMGLAGIGIEGGRLESPGGTRTAAALARFATDLGLPVLAAGLDTPAAVERALQAGCRQGWGAGFADQADAPPAEPGGP